MASERKVRNQWNNCVLVADWNLDLADAAGEPYPGSEQSGAGSRDKQGMIYQANVTHGIMF